MTLVLRGLCGAPAQHELQAGRQEAVSATYAFQAAVKLVIEPQ